LWQVRENITQSRGTRKTAGKPYKSRLMWRETRSELLATRWEGQIERLTWACDLGGDRRAEPGRDPGRLQKGKVSSTQLELKYKQTK
jgi:hypothetical protein